MEIAMNSNVINWSHRHVGAGASRFGIREGLASIGGDEEVRTQHVDSLVVIRIDTNLAVVAGAWILAVHLLPGLTAIVGAVNSAALLIFDNSVNHVRILAIDVQADAPQRSGRQAPGQLRPCLTRV